MRTELLPMAQRTGRNLKIEMHRLGSEMMRPKLEPNSVDLCFDNCAYCLKPDGLLAVNIANVSAHPTLADEFVKYAAGRGWR